MWHRIVVPMRSRRGDFWGAGDVLLHLGAAYTHLRPENSPSCVVRIHALSCVLYLKTSKEVLSQPPPLSPSVIFPHSTWLGTVPTSGPFSAMQPVQLQRSHTQKGLQLVLCSAIFVLKFLVPKGPFVCFWNWASDVTQPPWPRAPSESTQAPFPGLVSEDRVRVPLFLNRERARGPVWPQDGSPSCGNMELHFPVDGIPGS